MRSVLPRVLLLSTATQALVHSPINLQSAHVLGERAVPPVQLPAPKSINPDQNWYGIDGAWSTFTLRVGTPPQFVRSLISLNSYQTWLVLPAGCSAAQDQTACAQDRGSLFDTNASSTFESIGIYSLWIGDRLGLTGNALYGYDTVGLGGLGEGGPTIKNTTVGALAVLDFYLALFGVNPKPTNFTSLNDPAPSYITLLYQQNLIPSISFAYTAGAKYRLTGVPASLTLGGYDTAKFLPNPITFVFAPESDRNLVLAVQSITTPSLISSSPTATELLPSPIYALIDSTVPHIWLPVAACRAFELEFGLVYDHKTNLYLVNETIHQQLVDRNANLTFHLAQSLSGGSTVQIQLPYAAFDLEARPPYQGITNHSRYFPLQRAENSSQYTLGRTFLQEAYISVDWVSGRFNVSQVVWTGTSEQNLVPIIPDPSDANSYSSLTPERPPEDEGRAKLSAGAIAGMVVGAIAAVIFLAVIVVVYFRRREHQGSKIDEKPPLSTSAFALPPHRQSSQHHAFAKPELDGSGVPGPEHRRLLSLNNLPLSPAVPGTWASGKPQFNPAHWISAAGHSSSSTPSGGEGTPSSMHSGHACTPVLQSPSEVDGRERHVYEMVGDMPMIREKDGKALNEKEVIVHREKVYNGVGSAPHSAIALGTDVVREPRNPLDPEHVVCADHPIELGSSSPRRQFSFELERS